MKDFFFLNITIAFKYINNATVDISEVLRITIPKEADNLLLEL